MKWLRNIINRAKKKKAEPRKTQPLEPPSGTFPSFDDWYKKQGIKNFGAKEFTDYFARPLNNTPPRHLWPDILPALRVVDKARDHFGRPAHINSSYRAIPYNRNVGSRDTSQHVKFKAIDFWIVGVPPKQIFDYLMGQRNAGVFLGGLGLYSGFVHIDTRGENKTWDLR